MSKKNRGSVRIGPVSLFTLIILLSLAVLSVLTLSTAQAAYTSATKQASFADDLYQNEIAGNDLLTLVDTELKAASEQGKSRAQALNALESSLPEYAQVEGNEIQAQITAESGRNLTIILTISNDLRYSVSSWKATTEWHVEDNETLWLGA